MAQAWGYAPPGGGFAGAPMQQQHFVPAQSSWSGAPMQQPPSPRRVMTTHYGGYAGGGAMPSAHSGYMGSCGGGCMGCGGSYGGHFGAPMGGHATAYAPNGFAPGQMLGQGQFGQMGQMGPMHHAAQLAPPYPTGAGHLTPSYGQAPSLGAQGRSASASSPRGASWHAQEGSQHGSYSPRAWGSQQRSASSGMPAASWHASPQSRRPASPRPQARQRLDPGQGRESAHSSADSGAAAPTGPLERIASFFSGAQGDTAQTAQRTSNYGNAPSSPSAGGFGALPATSMPATSAQALQPAQREEDTAALGPILGRTASTPYSYPLPPPCEEFD